MSVCACARTRSMSQDHEGFLVLSNTQLVDEELCWQFGSTNSLACSSQYILVDKDTDLELVAVTTRKNQESCRQADIELGWQWIGHEQESCKCGLLPCSYCKEKKANDHWNVCNAVRGTRCACAQGELLAANCVTKGFNHCHGDESGKFVSQKYRQHITRPFASEGDFPSANFSDFDHHQLKIMHVSSMPSSKCMGDEVLLPELFQSASQPLVHMHNQLENSFEDRGIRGNALAKPEKLGAALCHSQTRARNAERIASEALIEKEKLAKLVSREASSCRMYKERVHLLELENLWLKRHVKDDHKEGCELPPYFHSSASRHCKFYKRGFAKDIPSEPSTVGLAFALGLSCASAGFVIGCCMGLIGLSH